MKIEGAELGCYSVGGVEQPQSPSLTDHLDSDGSRGGTARELGTDSRTMADGYTLRSMRRVSKAGHTCGAICSPKDVFALLPHTDLARIFMYQNPCRVSVSVPTTAGDMAHWEFFMCIRCACFLERDGMLFFSMPERCHDGEALFWFFSLPQIRRGRAHAHEEWRKRSTIHLSKMLSSP